ncbi:MAG: ABC transporter permease [Flavobacteriaceae bacterium]
MRELVATEFFKIWNQRKTFYALAAVLVLEAFIMISAFYQGKGFLELMLESLRESFEFQGNLLNGNLIIFLVLNSLWFHIPLILMIVVSGFLTSEYKDRTIEAVFLHPVSRWKFMSSKYLAAALFSVFVLLIMILSTFSLAYLFFGNGDLVVYLDGLSFFESEDAVYRLLGAFLSGIFIMLFYATTSLTLAVLLRESTITWIVSAIFLIGTTILLKFDFGLSFLNNYFFPKLINSWQYFFYNDIPVSVIITKNIWLLGYTIVIAFIGIRIFQKRDIGL